MLNGKKGNHEVIDLTNGITGLEEIEHLSGRIRKISVGLEINNRVCYQVGNKVPFGLEVSSIMIKRDFMAKFGKVHAVVNVFTDETKTNERVWVEIIDYTQIENDLSDLRGK